MNNDMKIIPELRFPEFEDEDEWMEKEFSNFIKLDRGSSPRPIREYLTQDASGVNWIKIGDTKNAINSVIYQVEEKITPKGAEKSRKVEKGELILANSMSFGKTYELAIEGCIYDGWFVLRKYEKYFIKPFLLQLLNSDFLQNQYKRLSAGGIVQNISSDIVYNSKLFYTSIPEQKKIAACLSSLDDLIAAHSQKLDLLKDHKKGLMQNLFPNPSSGSGGESVPKYRFPEFENDGEWVESTVENHCQVKGRIGYRGYTTEDLVGQGEGALVLGGKHIQSQLLELKDPTYLSWDKYYESPEIMVEVGDIIFSQRGTLGDCAIINREIGLATINPSMVLIKNITSDAYFLYYILIGDCIREEVRKNRTFGAIPMLSQKQIKGFSFLIPSIQEQQKIASCLSAVDELITAQAERIAQLQQHKKGLMQGLFPKMEG
jgi:type I restriction enzyme S subunit